MKRSLVSVHLEQQNLSSLSGMVEVYGQVAAGNLKTVKNDVVNSREFMDGLRDMFQEIKSAWEKRAIASTVLPHNDQEVVVFVSANLGFYGDIVERTYQQFASYLETNTVQKIVVLGREGKHMVATRLPQHPFDYVDFPDQTVEEPALKQLVNDLEQFERIKIFHGKYVSTITQEVVATKLEGETVDVLDYIFEPDTESIVNLFEGEILSSVVEQALREGQLSKFAARIMHLGLAMNKIEDRSRQVELRRRRLLQDTFNRKQRTRLVSVRLLKHL
ncbi:MAG TPA: F0F1 ATP synthase subunit gamma [Vitreimonas sp.]|nr:F0F1 ATP synthase subunit gamma [Vitreimonas sp.]